MARIFEPSSAAKDVLFETAFCVQMVFYLQKSSRGLILSN